MEFSEHASTDPKDAALQDEACAWIARLSSDRAEESDYKAFALWLSQSTAHRRAYDSMEMLWMDLGCIKYQSALESTPALEDQPLPGAEELSQPSLAKRASRLWRRVSRKGGMAAGFLLFAVALLVLRSQFSEPVSSPERYATAVGEQRSITLADGSLVHMNTNSRLEAQFSKDERHLNLSQGEAHFTVTKDPERPFRVIIPGAEVVAIGTAFNIEIQADQSLVTVTEGVVRVEEQSNSALRPEKVTAAANFTVSVQSDGMEKLAENRLEEVTAWRQQNLVFKDLSLAEVISELNRYSERKIKIADASLAFLQVSGVFKLNKPMETLQAIEKALNLQSKQQGQIILLYQRS